MPRVSSQLRSTDSDFLERVKIQKSKAHKRASCSCPITHFSYTYVTPTCSQWSLTSSFNTRDEIFRNHPGRERKGWEFRFALPSNDALPRATTLLSSSGLAGVCDVSPRVDPEEVAAVSVVRRRDDRQRRPAVHGGVRDETRSGQPRVGHSIVFCFF